MLQPRKSNFTAVVASSKRSSLPFDRRSRAQLCPPPAQLNCAWTPTSKKAGYFGLESSMFKYRTASLLAPSLPSKENSSAGLACSLGLQWHQGGRAGRHRIGPFGAQFCSPAAQILKADPWRESSELMQISLQDWASRTTVINNNLARLSWISIGVLH